MSYACRDHKPFQQQMLVQDGYFMDGVTRIPKMISIPFRMAQDCQYARDDKYSDPQCVGCKHKTTQKETK